MSNKVYYIQKQSPIVGHLRYPSRQVTTVQHAIKPAPTVTVIKNKPKQAPKRYEIDTDFFVEPDSLQQKPQRRRERLNHLTPEQKLNRRKMKNREAAQNARDRKKEQSKKMELTVRQLIAENRRLKSENTKLRSEVKRLSCVENQQQHIPTEPYHLTPKSLSENSSSPTSIVESAVLRLCDSLPWMDMMDSTLNRHRSKNALKSTPPITRPRKCHPSIRTLSKMRSHQNGMSPSLLRLFMFLAHLFSNKKSASSLQANSFLMTTMSRNTTILSKVLSSKSCARKSINGRTIRILFKKWRRRKPTSLKNIRITR